MSITLRTEVLAAWLDCRSHGCGRQAYKDVFTACRDMLQALLCLSHQVKWISAQVFRWRKPLVAGIAPTIAWHLRRPWRSATIVPYNRLALPPSMAVGHDCSLQSLGTSAVHGGRLKQAGNDPSEFICAAQRISKRHGRRLAMETIYRHWLAVLLSTGLRCKVRRQTHAHTSSISTAYGFGKDN